MSHFPPPHRTPQLVSRTVLRHRKLPARSRSLVAALPWPERFCEGSLRPSEPQFDPGGSVSLFILLALTPEGSDVEGQAREKHCSFFGGLQSRAFSPQEVGPSRSDISRARSALPLRRFTRSMYLLPAAANTSPLASRLARRRRARKPRRRHHLFRLRSMTVPMRRNQQQPLVAVERAKTRVRKPALAELGS